MVPTWLTEMVHFITVFWQDLQIGSSEKAYEILIDYLQLYQTEILELTIILLSQGPIERSSSPWQLEVILEDNISSPNKFFSQD